MQDDFFLDNSIMMDRKLPHALRLLFQKYEDLYDGYKHPKYT